jgi:hypothetical protein
MDITAIKLYDAFRMFQASKPTDFLGIIIPVFFANILFKDERVSVGVSNLLRMLVEVDADGMGGSAEELTISDSAGRSLLYGPYSLTLYFIAFPRRSSTFCSVIGSSR